MGMDSSKPQEISDSVQGVKEHTGISYIILLSSSIWVWMKFMKRDAQSEVRETF
jgi:hypothetical protein